MAGRLGLSVGQHGMVWVRPHALDEQSVPMSWRAITYFRDTDGVRRRVSKVGRSRTAAVRELSEILAKRSNQDVLRVPQHRVNVTIGGDRSRRPHVVYRFYNSEGHLLYVGISVSALHRVASHKVVQRWWGDVTRIDLAHYPNWKTARDAERAAIRDESPRYNIAS